MRIIQFADLGGFIEEIESTMPRPTVRVWPGAYWTGLKHVFTCWRVVNCQAFGEDNAILSAAVVMGTYEDVVDRPFGPEAERRQSLIDEHEESLVQLAIGGIREGAGIVRVVTSGQIYTGLNGRDIVRCYWSGFDEFYAKLKAVV